jgi:hypothetical protein
MGDKNFIEGFLAAIGKKSVESFPPKELGVRGNGVDNVCKAIPLLVNKILDGTYTNAGILVDADFAGTTQHSGFILRRKQITDLLAKSGYVITPMPGSGDPPGERFFHPDGHAPIGLFIMPNHNDDGMLEDILKGMIDAVPYTVVFQHAKGVVQALENKLFDDRLHISKAEIGTFLAWQKRPPAEIKACISSKIFNVGTPAGNLLKRWLEDVFV